MDLSNTLNIITESLRQILPEVTLACGCLIVLILELILKKEKLKTLFHVVILLATSYLVYSASVHTTPFNGLLNNDSISTFFKLLFLLVGVSVLFFPSSSNDLRERGEYHFLLLTLLLGAFFMVQAKNLLIFYLCIEILSISSYILTTFSFTKKGYEGGIKYLLFGALSSGIMLYGISLLYGLSGSLDIDVVVRTVFSDPSILGWLSLFFLSSGLLFKISLVPMHIWAPDVYESAPTPVVTIFSSIPKLAALFFLYRISTMIPVGNITWTNLLSVVAILSMFVGNLSALWQSNAKRMMAYSSIAHAGFLLIGVVAYTDLGLESLMFYGVLYAIMNVGVFYFIDLMEMNGFERIEQYSGIGKKLPFLGVIVLILMISLTGLPPTGGFTAKLLIFTALWDFYTSNQIDSVFWLFVLGLMNAVIALFYYLKIPYFMFFKESKNSEELSLSYRNIIFLSLTAAVVLALFFKADWLMGM